MSEEASSFSHHQTNQLGIDMKIQTQINYFLNELSLELKTYTWPLKLLFDLEAEILLQKVNSTW